MSDTEALSGRLDDIGQSFDNERDFVKTATPAATFPAEPERLAYFRQYLKDYFNDAFMPGMGAEEMLEALSTHGRGGRWMDLGAGTSSLFWSLGLENITEIWCCDVIPEALIVLDGFVKSDEVPPCYSDVMGMLHKPADHVATMRSCVSQYLVFNALTQWPSALDNEQFDLLTAFGTMGIVPNATAYAACIDEIARHLAPGGRAIGTDWIRSPAFIEREGHDNRYLDKPMLEAAAEAAGMTLLQGLRMPIEGDPLYDHILIWAFAKE